MSLFEAILATLTDQLPFMKNIIYLYTNNTNQYQNYSRLIDTQVLTNEMKNNIFVYEISETETQVLMAITSAYFTTINLYLFLFMKLRRSSRVVKIQTLVDYRLFIS